MVRFLWPSITRWWQLKYCLFSSLFGEDEPIFDWHIFQMRWFNHQPETYLNIRYDWIWFNPKNPWTPFGGVWICIAGFWDLQATSFEIPWFLGKSLGETVKRLGFSIFAKGLAVEKGGFTGPGVTILKGCNFFVALNGPPVLYPNQGCSVLRCYVVILRQTSGFENLAFVVSLHLNWQLFFWHARLLLSKEYMGVWWFWVVSYPPGNQHIPSQPAAFEWMLFRLSQGGDMDEQFPGRYMFWSFKLR